MRPRSPFGSRRSLRRRLPTVPAVNCFPMPKTVWPLKLRPAAFMILASVSHYAHRFFGSTPPLRAVVDDVHLTEPTVKKHLAVLVQKGLIVSVDDLKSTCTAELRDCFWLPGEIFEMELPPSAFMVYAYLLCCQDRRTKISYPSYRKMAAAIGLSVSTVESALCELADHRLTTTEHTSYINRSGLKVNGNNLYFLEPFELAMKLRRKERSDPRLGVASQKLRTRLPKKDSRHTQPTNECAEVEHEPLPF